MIYYIMIYYDIYYDTIWYISDVINNVDDDVHMMLYNYDGDVTLRLY